VLIASILGSGIVFLDSTVVNVALPTIRSALHGSLADQQWIVEAYLLTLSALLLVGGSLGDLRGRRRVMAEGLAGFGVCSLLCAVAPTSTVLIGARALQGAFGALLVPSSLALISDTFRDETERGAAVGTWTAYTGIATVIGPLGGGWVIQAASWRWIFAINVVPVLAALWMLARIPESPRRGCRIDWPGGVLTVLGLAGPVFALIEQPRWGWTDPRVLAPLLIGVALLGLLLVHERRTPEPMLPLTLFGVRAFVVANLTTFTLYGGLSIATFFIVLFIQQVGGYTPLQSGLALLPITVVMFTLSRRWGALLSRTGARPLMGFGPIVAGLGLLLEARVGASAGYVTTVLPGLLVFAFGLSMTVAPLTATVLASAGREHAGAASGINNAVSRVGGLIAIAAVGAVVAGSFDSHLDRALSRHRLGPAAQVAVARARTRPLVISDGYAPPRDRQAIHAALVSASVDAFHLGMEVAAALAIIGGLASLGGLGRTRTASEIGLPETDLRSA
jgi:EmrB/QacA subfamily drug resistance transporter